RLWTRAPWTEIVVRRALLLRRPLAPLVRIVPFVLSVIRHPSFVIPTATMQRPDRRFRYEEGELLQRDVAAPGEQDGRRGLVDEPDVGEVLARGRDADDGVGLLEVILDVAAGADVAVLAQEVDDRGEHARRAS